MAINQFTVKPLLDRILERSIPEPNTGCWLWIGCGNHRGYGQIKIAGVQHLAHRVSYELFVGPIPAGLQIDHLCRVRCCVNPSHLEPVTGLENARRGLGGSNESAKTHCPQGHAYTPENTCVCRGARHCRQCNRDRARVRRSHRQLAELL